MSTNASSLNAERALDILLFLGQCDLEGAVLSRIAAHVGGNKASVHRSLQALVSKGFAEPAERHGHYRLGPSVALLGRRHARFEPYIARVRPGMDEFTRRTGYTTYLMIRAGTDAVCADMSSRFHREQSMGVGARLPLGIAAGSLALLSLLPDGEAEQVMDANRRRYENYPSLRPVNREVIAEQLHDARLRGYAINRGLYFLGEGGLGLPVPAGDDGGLDMAVSFNIPAEYMNDKWSTDLVDELRECLKIHDLGP